MLTTLLVLTLGEAGEAQVAEDPLALRLPDSIAYLSKDQIEVWKKEAKERIVRDRGDVRPRIELGYLYLDQGVLRIAESYFSEALRFESNSPAAFIGLARVAQAQEDLDRLRENVRKALERAPEREEEILRHFRQVHFATSSADGSVARPDAESMDVLEEPARALRVAEG